MARSAVVEASEQIKRALDQIATLPETSALRREQLKLQIALANALMQLKGYAAPEPKLAFEQARLFMERAEAIGEFLKTRYCCFRSFGVFGAVTTSNSTVRRLRVLASQVMALAERQGTTTPLMVGHRLVGMSALHTGDIDGSRQHFDRAIALYDPAEHRTLAPRFGQDIRVAALSFRARALWLLGYPALALADVESALKDGREIDHGPSLMYALYNAAELNIYCGYYAAASKYADEVVIFATQKGVGFWKAFGIIHQSLASALLGNASDAVQKIASAINAYRSMGSTLNLPEYLGHLANAHTQLGQIDDVGSEDKLYDFIVEADPVKAIWSDRFARDFRSFRRHSEKCSSALVEMMAPRRRTIETSALEAEFLARTLSNCNLLAVSIGTPVRDSRYVP